MADSQRDVKNRIASVKNIEKITRAMEMVAAARLRRAEQRIGALRPYADAVRRMTRQAAEAAENIPSLPVLQQHESEDKVGILLVTGDRGLAGAFNSQILRAGVRAGNELEGDGKTTRWYASGLTQEVRRETLLPLAHATILGEDDDEEEMSDEEKRHRALVEYEPDPAEILEQLVPQYVEISIYRALLESTASEHGARMTAMRNASENAGELIDDLTLEMNRARQAEITQEIMEVVAGAESLR